jgi:hypothetical protein
MEERSHSLLAKAGGGKGLPDFEFLVGDNMRIIVHETSLPLRVRISSLERGTPDRVWYRANELVGV